jgi:hypothetical protein
VLGSGDVGKTVRVTVTATNAAGSASATSNASSLVAPAPAPLPRAPVNLDAPSVLGPTMAGKELKSTEGKWANEPTRFTYQWRRCKESEGTCESIANATNATYLLTSNDVGMYVSVVVTAWNAAGSTWAASDHKPNQNGRVRP